MPLLVSASAGLAQKVGRCACLNPKSATPDMQPPTKIRNFRQQSFGSKNRTAAPIVLIADANRISFLAVAYRRMLIGDVFGHFLCNAVLWEQLYDSISANESSYIVATLTESAVNSTNTRTMTAVSRIFEANVRRCPNGVLAIYVLCEEAGGVRVMVSERVAGSGNAGFTVIAAAIGTLIIAGVVIGLNRPVVHEYFAVRSAANSFVVQLKEAQRITIGEDRDRRIRITSEHEYVREKRAGAGWLFEEAYTLPEGLEIFGPHDIEFQSHSALSPVALYTISGPNNVRREIITQKNGNISRE